MTLVCDSDHRLPVAALSGCSRLGMTKRFIAAAVLASLALWSVPASLASTQPGSSISEKPAEQIASAHDHSCCPGFHSRIVLPLFVAPAPAEMPCGEQHPCCAKQTPQNLPALPAASPTVRPGSEGAPMAIAEQYRDGRTRITAEAAGSNPFQPYSLRSTVLRN